MDALRLLVRADLRTRRLSLLALAATTALVVGTVLAAAGGAHRTATALDRYLEATNSSDFMVGVAWPGVSDDGALVDSMVEEIAAVDGIELVRAQSFIPIEAGTDYDMGIQTPYSARPPSDLPTIVDGRMPRDDAPHEIALNELAAEQLELGVGDVLVGGTMSDTTANEWFQGDFQDVETDFLLDGPELELEVVGIVRGTSDLSPTGSENPMAIASSAFESVYADAAKFSTMFMLQIDEATFDQAAALEVVSRQVPMSAEVFSGDIESDVGATRTAFDAVASGLLIFAVVGLVAGLLVLALVVSRHLQLSRPDRFAASELGSTRGLTTATAAVPLVLATTVGVIGGSVLAYLASPLFPYGVVRRAEVAAGLRFDPLVHVGVAGCIWALLVVVAIVAARRATARPRRSTASSVRLAGLRAHLSPALADGCSTVLWSARRRATLRPWTAVVGAAVAIAGMIAIGTFEASRSEAASDARRFGETWDLQPDLMSSDPMSVVEGLAADDRVDGVGGVFCGNPVIQSEPTQVCAYHILDGSISPVVTRGRAPSSPTEVALGADTAERLGTGVGGTVDVTGLDGEPRDLTVVGIAVIADTGDSNSPGRGAVMTVEGLERLYGSIWEQPYSSLVMTVADGLDVRATADGLAHDFPLSFTAYAYPEPPADLIQLGRMRPSLVALAVFLGALGVVGLVHYLVLSTRRRQHEIATLRALGFVRRQVCESTVAQALTVSLIGLVIGVPLGLIIGRWTWLYVVRDLGIIDTPVTPWSYLLPILTASLAGAAIIAYGPGYWATRHVPGAALREE